MTTNDKTKTVDADERGGVVLHAYLRVIHGATSWVHVLPRSGSVLVGRAAEADLRIEAAAMSRRHARFIVADGEISVIDMESHNGTRVNGERIAAVRTLAAGDVVSMGDVVFIVHCEPRAASDDRSSDAGAAVRYTLGDRTIVVADPAMIQVFDLIRRLAARDMPILIVGETGTGKESAASALHEWSPRAHKPFVSLNCATLPETLVESELFGHERGAFSDAKTAKPGLLERAHEGTIFLDEVNEMSEKVQAKLLRVLETKRIRRLGELSEREVDVRVVSATNRDLAEESRAGRFRRDLFFRLSVGCVSLPPLKHRPREIPILARMFLAEERARFGQPPAELSWAAQQALAAYSWPGNVRELKNAMAWAAAMAADAVVEPWHLPANVSAPRSDASADTAYPPFPTSAGPAGPPSSRRTSLAEEVRQLELSRIQEALDEAGGVQVRAAALIGMPLRTFVYKLKQFGISPKNTRRRG